MDHGFIWETLAAVGLPAEFIRAIKLLYQQNRHFIKLRGGLFDGPTIDSGVRQDCPLSGQLFAIRADVILIRLQKLLTGAEEVARAFADDTATVVQDYTRSIGAIANIFKEYELISGLELNIKKTVFIPLWPISSLGRLRNLITELCLAWRNILIDVKSKYLGFIIGPGAGVQSLSAPLRKFEQRSAAWENVKCRWFWNSIYCNSFIYSVNIGTCSTA